MTDASSATSLTQHVGSLEAGGHVVAAAFIGQAPALALADGVVVVGEPDELIKSRHGRQNIRSRLPPRGGNNCRCGQQR